MWNENRFDATLGRLPRWFYLTLIPSAVALAVGQSILICLNGASGAVDASPFAVSLALLAFHRKVRATAPELVMSDREIRRLKGLNDLPSADEEDNDKGSALVDDEEAALQEE